MYWPFPAVTPADRLQRADPLDSARVLLSPEEAANRLGVLPAPEHTRLNTFDGRPVYRFAEERGTERIVYADTGEEPTRPTRDLMDRVASSWTRKLAGGAQVDLLTDVDQWTIQAPLRNLRPLWKYSWPDGEQVYISGTSGEVVQYTTTASRVGAYPGSYPALALFHVPPPASAHVEPRRHLGGGGCDPDGRARPRRRHLDDDVFDVHSIPRHQTLAYGARLDLRSRSDHVGVQWHAVDGPISVGTSRGCKRRRRRESC